MEGIVKLSIITINLNDAEGLGQTIKSVAQQKFPSLEYIIIDGGSADNSQQVIQQYSESIHYTISEKDNGIYHAMNKGIAKANGEYLLFLNSGDTLINSHAPETLLDNGNEADIIYGDIILSDGTVLKESVFPDKLTFKFFLINSLPHPCTLIRKKLFAEMGGYDETLKITSDWAFFLLAINKYNYSYQHVKAFVSKFNLDGICSHNKFKNTIAAEKASILKKYFPSFLDDYTECETAMDSLTKAREQFGYRLHNKINKIIGLCI